MRKIGRNEPCPCGSGLKYKKCCLKKNVIPFSPEQLDEQLIDLSTEMIEYGLKSYKDKINEALTKYGNMYGIGEKTEDKDHFIALSLPWILIHERMIDGQTIYEQFVHEKMDTIEHDTIKKALHNWKDASSSFYEIVSIENKEKNYISIQNVLTEKKHTIQIKAITEENIGNFIVGTLLQAVEADHFLYASIGLPAEMKDWIDEQKNDENVTVAQMNEHYIRLIASFIQPPIEKVVWEEPIYETVASEFVSNMEEKGTDKEMIEKVVSFWHYYSSKHRPIIRKEAGYIAALDYLLHQGFAKDDRVTQKGLAETYGVSSTTISGHFHKFVAEMEVSSEEKV
ncbi:YecA family protein [Pseudogracilibacillus sp. ICA-222130]|uniref:YecA family protein n=1 Tax=Pseudogracilibacillus sp. ICA-222130 TaxID=3134655 RepID=UPI0030C55F0C